MKKLGEILVESKLINEIQLEEALAHQKNTGGKLGHIITELFFVDEVGIARAISQHIKVPYTDIFSEDFSDEELKKVKESIIRKFEAIPVRKVGNVLEVAMSYPSNLDVVTDMEFALGCKIKPLLSLESEIQAFIRQYYSGTLVHRRSARLDVPEEPTLIQQESIWDKATPAPQVEAKIKKLVTLLVKKGILTSKEAASIVE